MLEEVRSLQREDRAAKVSAVASTYRKDDLVEYYSVTHGEWLPAIVTDADPLGRVMIDLRPGVWLSSEVQATKMRRRGRAGSSDSSTSEDARHQEKASEENARPGGSDNSIVAIPEHLPRLPNERRKGQPGFCLGRLRDSPRPPEEPPKAARAHEAANYDQLDKLVGQDKVRPVGRSGSVGAIDVSQAVIRRAPSYSGLANRPNPPGRRPTLAPLDNPPSNSRPPSADSSGTPPTRPGSGDPGAGDAFATPKGVEGSRRRVPMAGKSRGQCLAAAARAAGRVIAGA